MTLFPQGISALILTPGAGTSADHPGLVAIDNDLDGDLPVRRFDFAYRRAGKRAPPKAPGLVAEIVVAAQEFANELGVATEQIVLGGRSMGGRICSLAVAGGLPSAGLVLMAYPLHPPGKPDRMRTDHFPDLRIPCLFVSGTRDEFGTPAEFNAAVSTIPGPVQQVWCDGARHDLKGREAEICAAVRRFVDR